MFVELVDVVRAWFAKRGVAAFVDAGVNARTAQVNFGPTGERRVAFVPVPELETLPTPTHIGGEPRQLLNVIFVYDVSFAGYCPEGAKRSDDLLHRRVCIDLWEATEQAVFRAYQGAYRWNGARWEDARKDGRHGAELTARLEINLPLFDITHVPANARAVPGEPKPPPPEP